MKNRSISRMRIMAEHASDWLRKQKGHRKGAFRELRSLNDHILDMIKQPEATPVHVRAALRLCLEHANTRKETIKTIALFELFKHYKMAEKLVRMNAPAW